MNAKNCKGKYWKEDKFFHFTKLFTLRCMVFQKCCISEFKASGEIVEFDPPRVVAYTWDANWHENPSQSTLVRWELFPTKNGTRVTVTHSGLSKQGTALKDYSGGWPGVLDELKKYVET